MLGGKMMSNIDRYVTLTEQNFQQEVLENPTLVLVDCWASWCGSCLTISPVIHRIAIEFVGQIKIGRLNIATAKGLADQYQIRAVPTLLFFKDGQLLERFIGGVSKQELTAKLDTLLVDRYSNRSPIACL